MKLQKKLLKGSLQLGATQIVSQVCVFLRNLIVARILSPSDFGIAATFAVTMALLEMLGSLSADKLLVQAEDGDELPFQGAAHLIMVGRGLLAALLLFCLAGPVSALFGAPNTGWAFRWLSLIPLIRGFAHLDMYRLQREMRFGVAARVEMIANTLTVLAAWPLAEWLRDYSAMLWLVLLQAFVAAVSSHLLSERTYALSWRADYAARIVRFGWPLMINSLLMFGIFQGDRLIIGSASKIFNRPIYSLEDLGNYSVAFALTLAPSLMLASISSSLLLPVLSRSQNNPAEFSARAAAAAQLVALVGGLFVVPMIAGGGWLVIALYGSHYAAASAVVGWLAATQGLRMMRVTPTLVSMAQGDTKNGLISNILRSAGIVALLGIAYYHGSLTLIAAAGFMAELLALVASLWRLRSVCQLSPWLSLRPGLLYGLFMLLAAGTSRCFVPTSLLAPVVATLFAAGFAAAMAASFPALRAALQPLISAAFRRNSVVGFADGLSKAP